MDHFTAWLVLYGPTLLGWLCVISTVASGIVAATPTPPPDSKFRFVYRVIEYSALIFGYANDRGYFTLSAAQTRIGDKGIELGKEVINTTRVPGVPEPVADTTENDKTKALAAHIVNGLVAAGVVKLPVPVVQPVASLVPPEQPVGVTARSAQSSSSSSSSPCLAAFRSAVGQWVTAPDTAARGSVGSFSAS